MGRRAAHAVFAGFGSACADGRRQICRYTQGHIELTWQRHGACCIIYIKVQTGAFHPGAARPRSLLRRECQLQPGAFQPGAVRYVCSVTPVQAGYNIEKAAC